MDPIEHIRRILLVEDNPRDIDLLAVGGVGQEETPLKATQIPFDALLLQLRIRDRHCGVERHDARPLKAGNRNLYGDHEGLD
jgi:hypothetical protein